MAMITWDASYSVGIEEIDKQHQVLIGIINKLFSLYAEKRFQQTDVEPIFKELNDYADLHFGTEERYFRTYDYPEKEQHIALHDAYRQKVAGLKEEYDQTNSEQTLFAINNFLNDWWIWHINNADKGYSSYLLANGLK